MPDPDPLALAEETLAAIRYVQEAVARVADNARDDRLSDAELRASGCGKRSRASAITSTASPRPSPA